MQDDNSTDVEHSLLLKQLSTIATDLRVTLSTPLSPSFPLPGPLGELPACQGTTSVAIREQISVTALCVPVEFLPFPSFSPFEALLSLYSHQSPPNTLDPAPAKVSKSSTRETAYDSVIKADRLTRSERQMIEDLHSSGRAQVGRLSFTVESKEETINARSEVTCEGCRTRLLVKSVHSHRLAKAHR